MGEDLYLKPGALRVVKDSRWYNGLDFYIFVMKSAGYLTRSEQYSRAYTRGKSHASSIVVVKSLASGLDYPRFGLVVSKKVGNAVVRNHVRRVLREIVRQMPVETGYDTVIIARPAITRADFSLLKQNVEALFKKAALL